MERKWWPRTTRRHRDPVSKWPLFAPLLKRSLPSRTNNPEILRERLFWLRTTSSDPQVLIFIPVLLKRNQQSVSLPNSEVAYQVPLANFSKQRLDPQDLHLLLLLHHPRSVRSLWWILWWTLHPENRTHWAGNIKPSYLLFIVLSLKPILCDLLPIISDYQGCKLTMWQFLIITSKPIINLNLRTLQ